MLASVFDTCIPRDEIRAGELSLDLFAAKLRLVVEGKAPQVYGNPATFFSNTFATDGLKTLIKEVFGRLTDKIVGSPIIRLETSFGGGKTHDEIALWHIATQGRQIESLERFVDDLTIIPDHPVQVAAVDGRDLDPEAGIYHAESGITTYTLWGEIAYQIGGIKVYQLLGIAPWDYPRSLIENPVSSERHRKSLEPMNAVISTTSFTSQLDLYVSLSKAGLFQ